MSGTGSGKETGNVGLVPRRSSVWERDSNEASLSSAILTRVWMTFGIMLSGNLLHSSASQHVNSTAQAQLLTIVPSLYSFPVIHDITCERYVCTQCNEILVHVMRYVHGPTRNEIRVCAQ